MQKDKVVGGHWLPDRRFSPWNLKPFTDVMQNCSGKSKLTHWASSAISMPWARACRREGEAGCTLKRED